ncbi:hypothetical protein HMPREF1231_1675 [Streptococcus pyogenes GA06023]|nr:hypothetical protein HMPREF1231_1675 [Streptococcus pyogenes GA06023]
MTQPFSGYLRHVTVNAKELIYSKSNSSRKTTRTFVLVVFNRYLG